VITTEIGLAAGVLSARLAGRPLIGGSRQVSSAADLSSTPLGQRDIAAIQTLLGRRAAALMRRDREGFLADVDPKAAEYRARQGALFDNIREVPLATWFYDPHPAAATAVTPTVLRRHGAEVWATEVDLSYTLAGFDERPVVARQYQTFVRRSGRWYVGGDDDLASQGLRSVRGPWDFGPVTVLRSPHGLVLAHPSTKALSREVSGLLERAVTRVSATWSSWRRRVVVVVAGDAAEVQALVPAAGDLTQIAAVTAAEVDLRGGPPLGERVVLNPKAFGALTEQGREVVIQHEVTHVATEAVTSASTPVWLSEGFADYVGYLGQQVRAPSVARELAAEVRAGRSPATPPGEGEFAADSRRLAQSYQAAWLACRLIADRVGEPGLVRLYRTVSAGPGDPDAALDSGLRSVLGLTTEQFITLWRSYLRAQLG
jgi:hypothetical protein